ncbi:MAG: DUF3592 domain-containing protein [Erythrobacter sp.]
MTKSLALFGYIFFGVSALLLAMAGIAWGQDSAFASESMRADGVVIGLERKGGSDGPTYAPIVVWRDADGDAHRLVSSTSSYPASFERGEEVEILYDPDRPGQAVIDTPGQRFTAMLIFGFIGLVFALIGGPILYFYHRRRWEIRWLKRHGTPLDARLVRCDIDRSTNNRGRHPYRVFAQAKHPRTGKMASFKSEPIWVDLTSELEGQSVPVLINRKKLGPHFVDLSQWLHISERA